MYRYSYFLYAVAQYPAFCNYAFETGISIDYVCRRELVTLLTHMIEDSNSGTSDIRWLDGLS